jgi:hypothetical protein
MSPVAKRRGRGHTGRAVAVAVVGVAVALGTAFLVANLASRGDVQVRLGDDRFDAGRVENLARIIEEDGQPILFPDPANFSRSIYVDHQGGDPTTGWIALSAFVPDQPECTLTFDPEVDLFTIDDAQPDSCDRDTTFPRSGAGLRVYATEVLDDTLTIDLQDQRPAGD